MRDNVSGILQTNVGTVKTYFKPLLNSYIFFYKSHSIGYEHKRYEDSLKSRY